MSALFHLLEHLSTINIGGFQELQESRYFKASRACWSSALAKAELWTPMLLS